VILRRASRHDSDHVGGDALDRFDQLEQADHRDGGNLEQSVDGLVRGDGFNLGLGMHGGYSVGFQ